MRLILLGPLLILGLPLILLIDWLMGDHDVRGTLDDTLNMIWNGGY